MLTSPDAHHKTIHRKNYDSKIDMNTTIDFKRKDVPTHTKDSSSILKNNFPPSQNIILQDVDEIKDKESSFFIAAYDPQLKEIYFFNFVNERIIEKSNFSLMKNETTTEDINNKNNELNKRYQEYEENWKNIVELSHFDLNYFTSDNLTTMKFFQRPMPSKFLHHEKNGLNHFTSTYPLPLAFLKYSKVNLKIGIDQAICDFGNFTFDKNVGFYYVVDTIIKETLRSVLAKISGESEERSNSNDEQNSEKQIDKPEENPRLRDVLNKIKNPKNRFVLKLKSFEEYMFGDYPICTYESIRNKVREFEPVECILMMYENEKVCPNITNFPPIIYIRPESDFSYKTLLNKFLENFPSESIIYRFKPQNELKEFYLKTQLDRREKLRKYCESGENDFPFSVSLKGISNLFSLKKHLENPKYHSNEVDLYYFQKIPTIEESRNDSLLERFFKKFVCICRKKEKNEEEREHAESEYRKKLIKYKLNLETQENLNYLVDNEKKIEKYQPKKIIGPLTFLSYELEKKLRILTKFGKDKENEAQRFQLQNYTLKFLPAFVKLEIMLMYGSNKKSSISTRIYIVANQINMNERVYFDRLLFSHLPRETRICINILALDKYETDSYVLGCGQIPLFNENGILNSGVIEIYVWPLFKIDPRVICMNQYLGKFADETKFNKSDFCIVNIEFPKFQGKCAYLLKTPQSYKDFLKIKYPEKDVFDTKEIHDVYSTSLADLEEITKSLKNRDINLLNHQAIKRDNLNQSHVMRDKTRGKKDEDDLKPLLRPDEKLYSKNAWNALDFGLGKIREKLAKNPLEPISASDKAIILICRDYICTIPSALEIFLKAIDWFNPLQVHIAKLYIKKWAKIDPADAISLLDAVFPDTNVREYAISILNEMTDDLLKLYMLQLTQTLMYEIYNVSPLTDFLIEKSLKSPNLVGNSFFWNAVIFMKNKLFYERLSIITLQIFMLSGETFVKKMKKSKEIDNILRGIASVAKASYRRYEESKMEDKKERTLEELKKLIIEKISFENFQFPIYPTYFANKIMVNDCNIFGSKMVPMVLVVQSTDKSVFKLIYKCGDDLRQDSLILQILKIMDKLWLDENLDLKITSYKVLPTGLKEGFIEFVTGVEIDKLQQDEGVSGALDRELLIRYLRNKQDKGADYSEANQYDNFIKSLAGFCVATCVMGIADRHPGNVMLKSNGIFYHIDYGHILGNFKEKFGIKRERAPFLLTPEMAHVYIKDNKEELFKDTCVKAYLVLRKNASRLINLFIIMSMAGIPELTGIQDIDYLKNMLRLDKNNEEDARNYFLCLINQSKNEKFRLFDNMIHNWKHKDGKNKKKKPIKNKDEKEKEKEKENEKVNENGKENEEEIKKEENFNEKNKDDEINVLQNLELFKLEEVGKNFENH